jgi:hypothetical protein
VRRLTRRWIAPAGGRGSEGGDLGATRLTGTGNRDGTAAWRESTGRSEGVEGVVVQGPRDRAKAILLEAKFPVVQPSHPATRRLKSQPPASDDPVLSSQPFRSVGGRQ